MAFINRSCSTFIRKRRFQVAGLVAALSFVVVRLDLLDPFGLRRQAGHLRKEGCFVGFHFGQFVLDEGQAQLLIHVFIIPNGGILSYNFCAVLP